MHSSRHPARPAYTTYQLQRDNSLPQKLTDRSPDSLFPIKGKGQDRRAKCLATVIRINPHRKTTNGTRAVNRKTTAFTRSQRSRQIERTFSSRKRSINTRCSFRQLLIDSSYQPGILLQLFGRERNHLDRRSISAVIDSIVYNGLTLNFPSGVIFKSGDSIVTLHRLA